MVINHNMSAMFAQRQQKFNTMDTQGNIEKLSSGMRINRAGDDASGLAVSEKMRAQIGGLQQAERNAADGISLIQTAEGYLQGSQDILQRMRELAVQSSNGIYTAEDRMQIQVEISSLVDEVNRIASHAQFNGMNLLTGRFANETGTNTVTASMYFHIGANMDQRERVFIGTMTAQGLGIQSSDGLPHTATFISMSTPDKANIAIGVIDEALKAVKQAARRPRCIPEPARLRSTVSLGRRREHSGCRVAHPRHRHGGRDRELYHEPDSRPVVDRDDRTGQPAATERSAAAAVGKSRPARRDPAAFTVVGFFCACVPVAPGFSGRPVETRCRLRG